MQYTAQQIGSDCTIVPLNRFLSKPLAAVMGLFPGAPITLDNYKSMLVDSVCNHPVAPELGITLHGIDSVVPKYLADRDFTGQMAFLRSKANRD